MRKLVVPIVVLTAVGVAVAAYAVSSNAPTERADCPGKITCPQTGELVCRDQCPTVDPERPDCPGRITCPLTGELVCVDRCPLGAGAAKGDMGSAKASCCRGGDQGEPDQPCRSIQK